MTTGITTTIALCSAIDLAEADDAPEWINLLPAGQITTVDGRGPYRVPSMTALAAQLKAGDKLPIDESHSTDRAVPLGQSAPARGWIVELQARDGAGLWGRVEWTGAGRKLVSDKAYRGISPALRVDRKTGEVFGVLRASLVNTPNLQGLVTLHSEETNMDFKVKLIELLGLGSDADDDAIMAALSAKLDGGGDKSQPELQSVIQHPSFIALQSELGAAQTAIATLTSANARRDAEAFVDGAISEGRVGVKAARDEYIALHMAEPARAAALVAAMPKVAGDLGLGDPPAADAGGLSAADRQVIALMGISEDDYKASLAASGQKVETL